MIKKLILKHLKDNFELKEFFGVLHVFNRDFIPILSEDLIKEIKTIFYSEENEIKEMVNEWSENKLTNEYWENKPFLYERIENTSVFFRSYVVGVDNNNGFNVNVIPFNIEKKINLNIEITNEGVEGEITDINR